MKIRRGLSEQVDPGPQEGRRIAAPSLDESQRVWLSDLYESNFGVVFRVCHRVLHNPEDAADAAHEVFLRAVDSLPGRPTGNSARPWLITVARNHCLDVLRRRKSLGKAVLMLGASSDQGLDAEHAVIDRDVVNAILQQLGLRERQALWQSAVEHRPVADIASRFGLKYMAAAQLLHRARRHALAVATRLAAILGLYQLGRPARRLGLALTKVLWVQRQAPAGGASAAGLVVAAAIVPVMLAAMVSSASVKDTTRPVIPVPSALSNPATSSSVPPLSIGAAVPGGLGAVPSGSGIRLPSVPPLPTGAPTLDSLTTIERALRQLGGPAASPAVTVPTPSLPAVPSP